MTETHRQLIALLSVSLYFAWVVMLFLRHKKRKLATQANVKHNTTLVVYASQTGTAEQLAHAKAAELPSGEKTSVLSMASLTIETLQRVSKAIFVVSTYGEGEPPDAGRGFNAALMQASHSNACLFDNLQFEVVGLGDRKYAAFCQFAKSLFSALSSLGGQPLAPITTLDAGIGEHLSFFQTKQSQKESTSKEITLATRHLLNKGKQDSLQKPTGLYALSFSPSIPLSWEAGDVLDIEVSKGITRTYTIASVPEEKDIKLVVRRVVKDDASLGLGSGLLTHSLALNHNVNARIKRNVVAHINDTSCPLILIAAGSGIAGIRAQLAKRALCKNAGPVWIIFGERHPQYDNILHQTLAPFHLSSCIQKTSVIYSQASADCDNKGYVQHLLINQSSAVRQFLGDKGQLYVCGRFAGMGQGVDAALHRILGQAGHRKLSEQHRYHRDLY